MQLIGTNIFKYLKAPIMRVALPDAPTPASYVLEKEYYPDLSHKDFESGLALIHSRFSTNTFPSWKLA